MPVFDRIDICEAYYVLEHDYGMHGWLIERGYYVDGSVKIVSTQLRRMRFRPAPTLRGYASLTQNGREIYDLFVSRHHLPTE